MEQEITLSKNIISYISDFFKSDYYPKGLTTPEFYRVFDILLKNLVVIDKKKQYSSILLNDLNNVITNIRLEEFKKAFTNYLVERISLVECRLNTDDKYFIFDLCNNSDDKIYFDPVIAEDKLNEKKLLLKFSGYGDIELHSLASFLNPNKNKHRFIDNNLDVDIIEFIENNTYKLEKILKPYLKNSKYIEFIDKFLPNELSLYHLRKILSNCDNIPEIRFITCTKKDYLSNSKPYKKNIAENNYKEFEKLISDNESYIFVNINTCGHTERFIITDKYEILLPGGFDQIDERGCPKIDSEYKKLKMFIIKKQ